MDEIVARLRRAGCVFAEDEAGLLVAHAAETGTDLDGLAVRRCTGEPLEYIVGWAQFGSLRIAVTPGVFVPRQRTEHLAALATACVQRAGPAPTLLDLCCGAGAVAAAVRHDAPSVRVHAADIDPAALACARRNLGRSAQLYLGDLFAALPEALRGRFDVVVANAPYVPTAEIAVMPPEARDHERRAALDGGPDGLDIARRVVAQAPHWLAPTGHVLIEMSARQAETLTADLVGWALTAETVYDDESGTAVVIGSMP